MTYEEVLAASIDYFGGDELAGKVFVDKYALRNADNEILELTPDDMHKNRLAPEFARIEAKKFKKPLSEEKIYNLLKGFEKIIPQGSPMFGIGNTYQFSTLSNCYVVASPLDSYGDLCRADEQLVQISKRRGGVGIDLSYLRPAKTRTNNAARNSTGVVSFASRYSNSIREVGQDGRRGALMLTLSVHHPDILDFASCKTKSDQVTGANISVRLTDEFLNAVKNDEEYEQRWPIDSKTPKISKMVSARKVWRFIIELAHATAEPGILFWDNIIRESPADCYADYQTVCCNPCCLSTSVDVMVNTLRGIKEIKDILPGDKVWVDEAKDFCETSGYFSAGVGEIFHMKLSNGVEFWPTANHKFEKYPSLEMKRLSELHVGDHISRSSYFLNRFIITDAETPKFATIESIESVGDHEFGCIEVEKYHKFSANGMISGNSELPLSANDSCRLLLLNLYGYVVNPFAPEAYFDFDLFYEDSQTAQRLMDDIVDLELESIDRIISKIADDPEPEDVKARELQLWKSIRETCLMGRRTGTGITALADAIAAVGIKFGTDESIEMTEKIYKTLKLGCYRSSVDMAKELGPFPAYNAELEKDNPFLLRIKDEDPQLYADMLKYGRRNIALLTTAPAGSVSIEAQSSSGGEAVFMMKYTRRKKINQSDGAGRVDFVDQSGDKWQEFTVYHPKLKIWMEVTGETDITKSPYEGATAEVIDWKQRVKMQAIANRHVDHAISSTINLPEDVTVEKVAEIYEEAWKSGCKGMTVYRKNCRTGVLVEKPTKQPDDKIIKTTAIKRPKSLICDIYHTHCSGKKFFVVVGLLGKDPYEVIAGTYSIPPRFEHGFAVKKGRGLYQLQSTEGEVLCENIADYCSEDQEAMLRMVSASLRHGCEIHFVVEQLEKVKGSLQSFARALGRILKKYIADGTKVSELCPECNQDALERSNGCVICKQCAWSRCS